VRARVLLLVLASLGPSSVASAQEPFNVAVRVDQLATLFTDLFGPKGLVVDSLTVLPSGETHSAHFNSAFESEFVQFGTALTSQLVAVPLPSPASGFTYEFDPALGVFNRTTQSFGPILAERSDTIGADRLSIGFTYQFFRFDRIEGLDLASVPAVFTHDDAEQRGGREDVVTTLNSIDARVNQFTVFVTYGVNNNLDLSLAVPIVSTELTVVSDATMQRIGTTDPSTHFFRGVDGSIGDRRLFTAFGSASGVGDITVRAKSRIRRNGQMGFAVGLDLRLPTGDENNLLGTGAPGISPFGVWSATYGAFAPHVNLGYQWNGSSLLAGNPETGEEADLPDSVSYIFGADVGLNQRFTFAIDFLGRFVIDSPRLVTQQFFALDNESVFPNVTFESSSFNELTGTVGFKANVVEQLLVDFSLLFRLDNNGLRDKTTPLIGIEYSF
jgi:hypothetical protein